MSGFFCKKIKKSIDKYIGCRYYIHVIDITDNDIPINDITEEDTMGDNRDNMVLTEAVYYILLSLWQPMHGYGIMQNVMSLSEGRVNLAAGTLYGAINTMLEKGLIRSVESDENSRKKEYLITQNGKEAIEHELERLKELIRNGENIIGGLSNETHKL
jgi:DNA-binding PadR family transcriptional regulator